MFLEILHSVDATLAATVDLAFFFLLLRAVQLETSCKSPKACQKCSLLASNSNIRELTSSA